jgi:hypothetical protein
LKNKLNFIEGGILYMSINYDDTNNLYYTSVDDFNSTFYTMGEEGEELIFPKYKIFLDDKEVGVISQNGYIYINDDRVQITEQPLKISNNLSNAISLQVDKDKMQNTIDKLTKELDRIKINFAYNKK